MRALFPLALLAGGIALAVSLGGDKSAPAPALPAGPPIPPLNGALTDAELATVIAAANAGNAQAQAALATLNLSPDPAVQAQVRRVLQSLGVHV